MASAETGDRRRAERRGRRAETLAAWFLRAKGYRIVASRFRTPVGEIDLIVRRGRLIAFVEVKQRADFAEAAQALSPAGRRRIARAASFWLAAHPAAIDLDMRFDIVLCIPRHLPRHIADAFDADGVA